MSFLDDYEPVEERLAQFWIDHPEGKITTELLKAEEGEFIVHAKVWRDLVVSATRGNSTSTFTNIEPDATGLAHEVVGSSAVNKTSALENCETSAIGRALANLGYAPKGKRPSREEMEKATRPERTNVSIPPGEWLATAVEAYGLWTPDQRRDAYSKTMKSMSIANLKTMTQAKQVFKGMGDLYFAEFPDVAPF